MSTIDLFPRQRSGVFPAPRAFQDVAHRELRSGYSTGHRRQVLMAPTGAGKTYLGLRVCNEATLRGKRALFICDRLALIDQTVETALRYGMEEPGIIRAAVKREAWRPFQIASAQTIAARGIDDSYDVVVVDECHTQYAAVDEFLEATAAVVIGLSATPFTKGLGKKYSRIVNAATMDELVRLGVLTPMRVLSCKRPDMTGAKTKKNGEWTDEAATQRGMGIIGDVVMEWLRHADNAKTICFGPSIVHCEEMQRQFKAAGVEAALYTGQTDEDERKLLLAEYRKPDSKIRVLISVEALAKGFDVPDVACVCDCRPLRKSLSTAIQIWGRGLRQHGLPWFDLEATKKQCLLLDFSGNIIRFADDFADVYFNGLADLDSGEKLDKEVRKDGDEPDKPAKKCSACGYTPCGKKCIRCGFEPIRKSTVEHEHGTAEEVDVLKGAGKYAASRAELYAMIATHAKGRAGNQKGWTAHRYREITGTWPSNSFNFETAPQVMPSKALLGKMRSLQIAFAKRQGR